MIRTSLNSCKRKEKESKKKRVVWFFRNNHEKKSFKFYSQNTLIFLLSSMSALR